MLEALAEENVMIGFRVAGPKAKASKGLVVEPPHDRRGRTFYAHMEYGKTYQRPAREAIRYLHLYGKHAAERATDNRGQPILPKERVYLEEVDLPENEGLAFERVNGEVQVRFPNRVYGADDEDDGAQFDEDGEPLVVPFDPEPVSRAADDEDSERTVIVDFDDQLLRAVGGDGDDEGEVGGDVEDDEPSALGAELPDGSFPDEGVTAAARAKRRK
jgi:hypothetical protein